MKLFRELIGMADGSIPPDVVIEDADGTLRKWRSKVDPFLIVVQRVTPENQDWDEDLIPMLAGDWREEIQICRTLSCTGKPGLWLELHITDETTDLRQSVKPWSHGP